ncbi:MAG: nucleotidyltransferase domain-containing protein [Lachnospiraceae bacterium]|nr:nucleotidyltransferase domain-containing protein [Lachnospiraceae bacterium]
MWNEEPRETELAFKVADRIISIQECEEGYDYSIMDENYREIDGGVYDNPDVDIRYALLDIVDDLATHPDTNGAKGKISSNAKWVQLDFDEVSEQLDIANLPGPEVFMSRVVMEFKAKTEECFRKIGNMSAMDIEECVAEYVSAKLYENDFDAEIIGVVISGSRCRGLEGKNSDLDVVVQLSGNEREDDLFNLLHEDKFRIGGVLVDINPITEYKTGTLEEYLPVVEKYLEEKAIQMGKKQSVTADLQSKKCRWQERKRRNRNVM